MKNITEVDGTMYLTCTACMSVLADGLSWANANPDRIVNDPYDADNIIVLSCQVTDLAVLNDLRRIEELERDYPGKRYFISGCLARRKDIDLPYERLNIPRQNYQSIDDKSLVHFSDPFWVDGFENGEDEFKNGHLFRNMYPLRIGKSCPFNCSYCTIKITRGKFESYDMYDLLEQEFLAHEDVLLIADSPTPAQIRDWCKIAKKYGKHFSIRNVEPQVAMICKDELLDLANKRLLKVFHSPIQSGNLNVLKDMRRNVDATVDLIDLAMKLKDLGVFIATNIIIDYKSYKQDFSDIYYVFDYVSWNPYWDGLWSRKKAEKRFDFYLKQNKIEQDVGIRFK